MEQFKSIRQIALAILFTLVLFCSGAFVMDVQAAPDSITINGQKMDVKSSWSVGADSSQAQRMGLKSGTISLDPDSSTLTLDNVQLSTTRSVFDAIEYGGSGTAFSKAPSLTVRLVGDNTITIPHGTSGVVRGLNLSGARNIYIDGPGSLTINTQSDYDTQQGICTKWNDRLTIRNNATININMDQKESEGIHAVNNLTVKGNARVNVTGNPGTGIWFEESFTIDDATVESTGQKYAVYEDSGFFYYAKGVTVNNGILIATGTEAGIHAEWQDNYAKGPCLTVSGDSEVLASGSKYALNTDSSYEKTNYLQLEPNGGTLRMELKKDSAESQHDYTSSAQIQLKDELGGVQLNKGTNLHIYSTKESLVRVTYQNETLDTVPDPEVIATIKNYKGEVVDQVTLTTEEPSKYFSGVYARTSGAYTVSVRLSVDGQEVTGFGEYHVDVSGNIRDGYTITVCGGEENLKHVPVSVVWQLNEGASRPNAMTVVLKKNGEVIATKTINDANDWSTVFDCYDTDELRDTYSVEVTDIDAGENSELYQWSVSGNVQSGRFTILVSGGPEKGSDDGSGKGNGKGNDSDTGLPCEHVYDWEIYKAATATEDGIMRYRCTKCGDVEYEVPTAAYYVFNKDTQELIKNAAPGATVCVETPIFISFHEMVKDALVARSDVTLVVTYKNEGKTYEMTIPAGSGETLTTLFGDSQYAGFLYLGGAFATVEK